jgi:hypothetical protein
MALVLEVTRRVAGSPPPVVWVEMPSVVPAGLAAMLAPDLDVRTFAQSAVESWKRLGRSLLGSMILRSWAALLGLAPSRTDTLAPAPTILTVQEEDLVDDRSYRGMLYWLDPDVARPACRTVVMPQKFAEGHGIGREYLNARRIVVFTKREVARCVRRARNDVHRPLDLLMSRCVWRSLTAGTGAERAACVEAWKLLAWAKDIAAVAEATGARAWVGCEGWQTPNDAVNVVADHLSIKTCNFQYGSIRVPTPTMVTTADVAAIIGEIYAPLFRWNGIGARSFQVMGYPYAYAFPLVADRSKALRTSLKEQGADFVVGFFDESVQYSRWGLISRDRHLHELTALAKAVLEDRSLAVIVKPKYVWNNPKLLYPNEETIQAAFRTRRFLVMEKGARRTAHFPAEVALACDLCIGHVFATSASLEAALTGTRSVLMLQYGENTLLDAVLSRVDVIYPSIDAILEATARFRSGDRDAAALGDWSPILTQLEPYRDGKAAQRLRELLEGWALSAHTQRTASSAGHASSARTATP